MTNGDAGVPLAIDTEDIGPAVLVHVHGEVDIATAPMLHDAIVSAIRNRRHAVVDVRDVAYIDMSGFHALEDAKQSLDGGQLFALAASAPHVDKLVEILQFDKVIPTSQSTEDALDFIRTTSYAHDRSSQASSR